VQLVSKISNLCGPDPPTSQTHRRTDDMQSQYGAMHYSASRGKKVCSFGQPCCTRETHSPTLLTEPAQRSASFVSFSWKCTVRNERKWLRETAAAAASDCLLFSIDNVQ